MQSPTVPTDNNILAVIANRTLSMNPALRRIGEYILAHPEDCKVMAIRDLAQAAGVADSTVTRFVKELPLSGFQELKIRIAEALSLQGSAAPQEGGDPYIFDNMDPEDSAAVMADKLCHQFVDLLWQCRRMADLHTVDACALLVDKAHTVTICCSGSSPHQQPRTV